VRTFLRRRLGITVADYADEPADALPVALDPLELWGVGQRLLAARRAGVDRRTADLAEIARGRLPPGQLARPVIDAVDPVVEAIVARAGKGDARAVDIRLALPGERTLSGTVAGVVGDELRTVTFSRIGTRQRLAAWVRLLALTAALPERPWSAVTVGRALQGEGVTVARLRPPGAAAAAAELAALIDLFDRGMRAPPPLYSRTSAAYVADGAEAARKEWESDHLAKEDAEPEHTLVFAGRPPFAELTAPAPLPAESGPGWKADETTRFGRWAHRLWDGLRAHEELGEG
jgi:exodeoxyribonuclease V gamma subunit